MTGSSRGLYLGLAWGALGAIAGANFPVGYSLHPPSAHFTDFWWLAWAPAYAACISVIGWHLAKSLQDARSPYGSFYVKTTAAMAAYMALVIASGFIARELPEGPLRYLMALLPILPILYLLAAYRNLLGAVDELQRRIELEAWLISAVLVGMASFSIAFLQIWSLLPEGGLIFVFPGLFLGYGLGKLAAQRRYQ